MNGVSCNDSALEQYTGPLTTWANEMIFVMKHEPDIGSLTQPVDQQSS